MHPGILGISPNAFDVHGCGDLDVSKGANDFSVLQAAMGTSGHSADMLFCVFDLLHLDGFDLRAAPLIERKRVLKGLLRDVGPPILFSDHMEGDGQKMFEHACAMGLEGVVSKRVDAAYRSGRSESWLKVKCVQRGTFTVVGFSPEGSGLVAALYLARKEGGRGLTFVGKVGTGWTMRQSVDLRRKLDPLTVETPAVEVPGKRPKAIWVRPRIEVDVTYRTITAAGMLRHAVWKGLKLSVGK